MMEGFLSVYLFPILLAHFLAVCILFILNFRGIRSYFSGISRFAWLLFILIFLLGLYLRIAWPGCGSEGGLCWDYVKTAMDMLEGGTVADFWHPKAYSLLILLGFSLFGMGYETILNLNILLSTATIFAVFLLAYALFKREDVSLFSSLIYALFPVALFYTKYNISEVTTTFFLTLTLAMFLVAIDTDKRGMYALSLLLLVFSMQVRTDTIVILPVFVAGFLMKRRFDPHRMWLPLLLFIIFMIPASQYYITGDRIYGPHDDPNRDQFPYTFSVTYLPKNMAYHAYFLLNPQNYPHVLYIFMVFSLLWGLAKRDRFPVALLWIWFVTFFLFYGLYWATTLTNPELYHLMVYPAMAVMIGHGIFVVKHISEQTTEKFLDIKIPDSTKSLLLAFVLVLILVIFSTINVFAFHKLTKDYCLVDEIRGVSSLVGEDDCLVVENLQSDYVIITPKRIVEVLLPGRSVLTTPDRCSGKIFYLYINQTICQYSFFGEGKPVWDFLKKSKKTELVREEGCVKLYRVE